MIARDMYASGLIMQRSGVVGRAEACILVMLAPHFNPREVSMKQCKCDLRTRLVGDGCDACNPELARELSQEVSMEKEKSRKAKDGRCCSCGYECDEQTPCPSREDKIHCVHWWEKAEDETLEEVRIERDSYLALLNGESAEGNDDVYPVLKQLKEIAEEKESLLSALEAAQREAAGLRELLERVRKEDSARLIRLEKDLNLALARTEKEGVSDRHSDEWERGCLEVTRLLEEHPEEWDGPCECQGCLRTEKEGGG